MPVPWVRRGELPIPKARAVESRKKYLSSSMVSTEKKKRKVATSSRDREEDKMRGADLRRWE